MKMNKSAMKMNKKKMGLKMGIKKCKIKKRGSKTVTECPSYGLLKVPGRM
jgi:hypothetical protein